MFAHGMCRLSLAGVETSSMATIWNAWAKHRQAQDADVAQNLVDVIAQVQYFAENQPQL